MKLKTSLHLSAVFPILFAIVAVITLRMWYRTVPEAPEPSFALMAWAGIVGLVMCGVIVWYTRDISAKVVLLNKWTDAVLKGDLDSKIDIDPSNDEVGRLSAALSKMLADLRRAYSELHDESEQRKAEAEHQRKEVTVLGKELAASKTGVQHLSGALSQLQDTRQGSMREERAGALARITNGLAHRIGNVLMTASGTTEFLLARPELLQDETLTLPQLRTILSAIEESMRTIRRLSVLCEMTERAIALEPTDVHHVVAQALHLTSHLWKETPGGEGVPPIKVRTDLRLLPSVSADADDLQDSIVSLIVNAVEAMPDGGSMTIAARAEGSTVSLEVRDTGEGMTEETRGRCLEPFFSTKKGPSHGMGLAIVQATVKRYGGELKIESEAGKGSRITMELPVWTKPDVEDDASQGELVAGWEAKILVVSREFWLRERIAEAFASEGHTVETAPESGVALDRLKAETFDAVIIDDAVYHDGGAGLPADVKQRSSATTVVLLYGLVDATEGTADLPDNVDMTLSKRPARGELMLVLERTMPDRE